MPRNSDTNVVIFMPPTLGAVNRAPTLGAIKRAARLGAISRAPTLDAINRAPTTEYYIARLSSLNSSGVYGTIDLRLAGNRLVVIADASGLEPNQIHYQHIHGSHDTASTCPTAADANASGIITVDRTLQIVGPVALGF